MKTTEGPFSISNKFSEIALDSVKEGIAIISVNDYRIVGVNQAFVEQLGLKKEEVIGRHCYEINHHRNTPCSPPDITCPLLETLKTGKHAIFEHMHSRENGNKVCYVEVSTSPIEDEKGRLSYVVYTTRDISERKRAEQLLRDSEERYRVLAESAHEFIFIINRDQSVQYINNFTAKQLGYRPEDIVGKSIDVLLPQVGVKHEKENLQRVFETGEAIYFDKKIVILNREVWLGIRLVPIRNKTGEVTAVLGIARDITEHKMTQERLHQTASELQAIFQALPDLYFRLDVDGTILDCKAGPTADLHVVPEAFTGKRIQDVLPPNIRQQCLEALRRVAETNSMVSIEYSLALTQGEQIFEVRLLPFLEKQIIAIIRNITERKQTEESLRKSELQYRTTTDSMGDAIHVIDRDLRLILTNSTFKNWNKGLGLPTDVTGRKLFETFPFLSDKVRDEYQYVFRTGKVLITEERTRIEERDLITETRKIPILEGNRVARIVTVMRDITERKKIEDEMQKANLIIENSPTVLLIWGLEEDWPVRFVSKNIAQFGYQPEDFYSGLIKYTDIIHPEDLTRTKSEISQYVREGRASYRQIYRVVCKNRDVRWVDDWTSIEKDEKGVVKHHQGIIRDITELKLLQDRLNYLAHHDALTGLPNRLLFNDRLGQSLAWAHRYKQLVAVMFIDLDRFKEINDSLGHDVGDALLQAVARRLTTYIREIDTVARLGGDEFTFILPDIIDVHDAEKIADRILDSFSQPFMVNSHEISITPSIGISLYPAEGDSIESLMKNADIAMYRAKAQGRNNYQFFAPAMSAVAAERIGFEKSIREAIERKEFLLHYQPLFDLLSGQIVGTEALLRWNHPDLGMLFPMKFLHLAERTGLIIPIGDWVLLTACAQNRSWQSNGFLPMRISVNLSARQFQQQNLLEKINLILSETGLNPNHLELEITENTVMQNLDNTLTTLRKLRERGIRIAIDDYGSGYSSLSYFKKFPINTLKIDRALIQNITNSPDDAAIVAAIIAMAHSLKLEAIIAEGVENASQLEFLRSLKCDIAQGYFFNRPMPPEEVTYLLKRTKVMQLQ